MAEAVRAQKVATSSMQTQDAKFVKENPGFVGHLKELRETFCGCRLNSSRAGEDVKIEEVIEHYKSCGSCKDQYWLLTGTMRIQRPLTKMEREAKFVEEHPEFDGRLHSLRDTFFTCRGKTVEDVDQVELETIHKHCSKCDRCKDRLLSLELRQKRQNRTPRKMFHGGRRQSPRSRKTAFQRACR